jgi:hypothetical protein
MRRAIAKGWARLGPLAVVACVGCKSEFVPYDGNPPPTYHITQIATDGQVFSGAEAESSALRASGAHDLACPIGQVTIPQMVDEHGKQKFAVEGCGQRALYFWDVRTPAPYTQEHRVVLSGLVPLTPPVPL